MGAFFFVCVIVVCNLACSKGRCSPVMRCAKSSGILRNLYKSCEIIWMLVKSHEIV